VAQDRVHDLGIGEVHADPALGHTAAAPEPDAFAVATEWRAAGPGHGLVATYGVCSAPLPVGIATAAILEGPGIRTAVTAVLAVVIQWEGTRSRPVDQHFMRSAGQPVAVNRHGADRYVGSVVIVDQVALIL